MTRAEAAARTAFAVAGVQGRDVLAAAAVESGEEAMQAVSRAAAGCNGTNANWTSGSPSWQRTRMSVSSQSSIAVWADKTRASAELRIHPDFLPEGRKIGGRKNEKFLPLRGNILRPSIFLPIRLSNGHFCRSSRGPRRHAGDFFCGVAHG